MQQNDKTGVEACKKVRYATEQFAREDVKRIQKKSTRDKVPYRAYFCDECRAWHLTSQKDWKIEKINVLEEKVKEQQLEIEKLKKITELDRNLEKIPAEADIKEEKLRVKIKRQKKVLNRLRREVGNLTSRNSFLERQHKERLIEFKKLEKELTQRNF